MDRFLYTDRGALEKRTCDLYLVFTAGTSGVIPTTFTHAEGFGTITLDSTGVITANLQDTYYDLLFCDGRIKQASASVSTASRVELKTNSVTSGTAPLVTVNLLASDDGAVADMGTGDIFFLHLILTH